MSDEDENRRLLLSKRINLKFDALRSVLHRIERQYGYDSNSALQVVKFVKSSFTEETSGFQKAYRFSPARTSAILSDLNDQITSFLGNLKYADFQNGAGDRADEVRAVYKEILDLVNQYRLIGVDLPNDNRLIFPPSLIAGGPDLPAERAAPVRVKVVNNQLSLSQSATHTGSISADAAERVRKALAEILDNSFSTLGGSHNVDPRFIVACKPFYQHLNQPSHSLSIEALGLNWHIFGDLLDANKESLPDAVLIQLERVRKSTNVLLSQYEEWRVYLGEEAVVGLQAEDIQTLIVEAAAIAEEVSASPEAADAEIGKRLMEMVRPVVEGIIRADTVATPLVGSLSNLLSQAAQVTLDEAPWAVDLAHNTLKLSEKGMHNPLLILALGLIARHYSNLSKMPPFRFMNDAYNLALKHFPWAKDTLLK